MTPSSRTVHKTFTCRSRFHLHGFPERVLCTQRNGEFLFQEILTDIQTCKVERRLFSLQLNPRTEITTMQINTKIFRQIKLCPCKDSASHTILCQSQCLFAVDIRIIQPTVHIDTEQRNRIPTAIQEQSDLLTFSHISISAIRSSVILRKRIGFREVGNYCISFNRIINKCIAQTCIYTELLCKLTKVEVHIITLFRIQIRITLRDTLRVDVIQIRIQIPDPRTLDTHIVS